MVRNENYALNGFADVFPVMLLAEDICGRQLGLCRYAYINIDLTALVKVLPRQMSWQTKGLDRPGEPSNFHRKLPKCFGDFL